MWAYYLFPLLLIGGIVGYVGRFRIKLVWLDYLLLILPYWCWGILMYYGDERKSLANLVEAFWLGCIVILIPVIRVIIGRRFNEKIVSALLLTMMSIICILFYFLIPALPE